MCRSGYPSQSAARIALHRVLACEQAGIHVDDRQTVSAYLTDWLAIKSRTLKPTTLARYTDYINKDLCPALGHIRLEELSHHNVADFITDQLGHGRRPVTLRRCVASSALSERSATTDSRTTPSLTLLSPDLPGENASAGHPIKP
jgi:hypothetical protein